MRSFLTLILLSAATCWAQDDSASATQPSAPSRVIVPAGTKLLLALKSGVNSKTARVGDGVYLETTFPVAQDNRILIPAGTYVQGVIDNVRRSGRIKGRAEVLFHFNTLIFPNGYTVTIPGALESVPGADSGRIKDKEGTVQAEGTKGKDAGTIASTAASGTATGALIGAVTGHPGKGLAIGSLGGAAVGLAEVLLTRGEEIKFEQGTAVEMVFQRPLELEERRLLGSNNTEFIPANQKNQKLPKPELTPRPDVR
jgi:hypothetical protein